LRSKLERQADAPPPSASIDMDVMNAIRTLPPKQRAAVVLFYFEDLPLADVADVMECAAATARVHLHRARARLGELLGEEVGEDAP
jgi:RNA polymerase sigma factor (sigma-70 family)